MSPPRTFQRAEGPLTNMQVLRWVAEEELSGHIETYSADYAASQYMDIATDEEIDLFLKSTPLYDNDAREWTHLVDLEAECDIYARIHHIIQTVVSSLGRVSSEEGVSREVVATNYRRLAHVEQRDMGDASTPAIVVKATGPSFEDPVHDEQGDATPLGYTNIASCFHVRLEELLYDEDVYYAQESGIFARQMLIQQPNRRFVRNLMISEEVCYLYHFDRSGAQYTPHFNIHQYPKVFIRLVLGLSSPDEAVLGLDTAVQWTIRDGRKVAGTIVVTNADGMQTPYKLCELEPVFRRYDIRGRGTTGWSAMDPEGRCVFIKDCWRTDDGFPEYEVLKETIGVQAAAQMRDFESREVTTMELRGHGARKWSSDAFKNRISTRIVMDVYGESILFFKSQKQLVAAIRDAIAAHRTLVNERDVLHRDISQNNILLGNEGARPGERGVLIDFDMALRGRRPLVHASGENTVGTRLFMSVAVLTTSTRLFTTSPHHDQLDDLESFYYVFYDLVNTWEGVGKQVADRPEEVKLWDVNPNPFTCAAHKQAHFFLPETPAMRFIPPYWLPATRELVIGMYQVIRKLILLKVPCRELKIETRKTALRELLASADQYYDEVLALFDKALDDLDTQESSDNPSAAVDSSIVDSSPSLPMVGDRLSSRASVNSLKRALPCDDEKPTILTKRARIASGPPPFSHQ